MSEFVYTRKEKEFTLPFNPTEIGWEYLNCNCASVKFQKVDGMTKTMMAFGVDNKKIEVTQFRLKEIAGVTGAEFANSIHIDEYPENQEDLERIVKQNRL